MLSGKTYSKSTVSESYKVLDAQVKQFRESPLTGEYPFLILDATYFKVREQIHIISKALMIAFATVSYGHLEVIGFCIKANESNETWNDFFNRSISVD